MAFQQAKRFGQLPKLYDAASATWQQKIDRLGYPGAYAELTAAAVAGGLPAYPKVLDVGTGTGALASVFAKQCGPLQTLDLIDVSQGMLEIAGANLRIHRPRLIEGAIGEVSLPEDKYDVILCAHTIEHVPDPIFALTAMRRLLRPGGNLIMSISKPHWCTALIRWRWGHRAFTRKEVNDLFLAAGLTPMDEVSFSKGPPSRTSHGYIATV